MADCSRKVLISLSWIFISLFTELCLLSSFKNLLLYLSTISLNEQISRMFPSLSLTLNLISSFHFLNACYMIRFTHLLWRGRQNKTEWSVYIIIMFEILNSYRNLTIQVFWNMTYPTFRRNVGPSSSGVKYSFEDKATTLLLTVKHRSRNETASHLTRPEYQ